MKTSPESQDDDVPSSLATLQETSSEREEGIPESVASLTQNTEFFENSSTSIEQQTQSADGHGTKSTPKSKAKKPIKTHYNGVPLPSGNDAASRNERRRMRNKLSAQVYRQRKQDTLNSVKQEVEERKEAITKLKQQLEETRSRTSSMQSVIKNIESTYGPETVGQIYQRCHQPAGVPSVLQLDNIQPSSISSESGNTYASPRVDVVDDDSAVGGKESYDACRKS